MGWPLESHEPLSAILGLEVCESCFNDIKTEHFFGPDLDKLPNNMRGMFEIISKGKQPPDFARAFIERISIASKEYAKYKDMISKKDTLH